MGLPVNRSAECGPSYCQARGNIADTTAFAISSLLDLTAILGGTSKPRIAFERRLGPKRYKAVSRVKVSANTGLT